MRHSKILDISDIVAETPSKVQVKIASTGKIVWITRKVILEAVPRGLIILQWYYDRVLAAYDHSPSKIYQSLTDEAAVWTDSNEDT